MTEAIDTMPTPRLSAQYEPAKVSKIDMEAALGELVGAAQTAAVMLEFRANLDDRATSVDDAMVWLSAKLVNAAETATAIYDGRPPRWDSHGEANAIRDALDKAAACGAHRAADREADRPGS